MNTKVKILISSLCIGIVMLQTTQAVDITKTNNSDDLDLASSWVGGIAPTGFDVAVWDNTVATASSVAVGVSAILQWNGIRIVDPANNVTINATSPGDQIDLVSTTTSIDMTAATKDLTINCDLNASGNNQIWNIGAGQTLTLAGDVLFPSAGNVAKKRGDGTLRLTAEKVANSGNGNLWLEAGKTLLVGGGNRVPTNGVLRVGGINGPTATLDLGGNSHLIARMLFPFTDTTNANRAIFTNGSLIIRGENGSGNTVLFAGDGSQTDFSGLDSLTANLDTVAIRNFSTTPYMQAIGTTNYNATNTTLLARTNIIRGNLGVGGSGQSGGVENLGRVRLGAVNDLRLNQLTVGGFNARGQLSFQDGLINPTVSIRGTNGGTERLPNLLIGDTSSGTRPGGGTLDLSAGTVDILGSFLRLGRAGAANSFATENSRISMSAGTVDILAVQMGVKFASGFTNENVIATFNQLGGAVKFGSLVMGTNAETGGTYTGSAPNWQLNYNLGAGTFRAATIFAGLGTNGPNSVRAINWTNGTIEHYDAVTDLLITNNPALSNGIVINAPGVGTRAFNAEAGRAIVIAAALRQDSSSATPISKTGIGTLELSGGQDNGLAGLDVVAGSVLLNKASDPAVHALGNDSIVSGGTLRLGGTGGDQIADTAALVVNSGSFDLNGLVETIGGLGGLGGSVVSAAPAVLTLSPELGDSYSASATFSGSFDLIKAGAGRQTYAGTDSRSAGTNVVELGDLVIAAGTTLAGSTTVNPGATLMGSGTLSGTTVFAGGTLSPGTSIGTLTFGNGLSLQSGSTVIMELDLSQSPGATNDSVVVVGSVVAGGTIEVTNIGPALVIGSKFQLFNSAVAGFTVVNLPSGYTWLNDLALDGSITVTGSSVAPTLEFTQGSGSLTFTWTPASGYKLQAQTNSLSTGVNAAWFDYPGGGTPPIVVPVNGSNPTVFFRLKNTP